MTKRKSKHSARKTFKHKPILRPLALAIAVTFCQTATVQAVDYASICSTLVTVNTDNFPTLPHTPGSLREAINCANASSTKNEITFSSDLNGSTIQLNPAETILFYEYDNYLSIRNHDVTITGPTGAANRITIKGNKNRIFSIFDVSVDLENLTLTDGDTTASQSSSQSGGAIYQHYQSTTNPILTLTNTTVTGNIAGGAGGGIAFSSYTGELILNNSIVHNNSTAGTSRRGGGIFTKSDVTLNQSTISSNNTSGLNSRGGGISTPAETNGVITLNQSSITGNSTNMGNSAGGGIFAKYWNVELNDSTVSNNSTIGDASHGGGVYATTIQVIQSTISNNTVSGSNSRSGGLHIIGTSFFSSTLTPNQITQSTITENTSTTGTAGADIYEYNGGLIIKNSIISNNTTGGDANYANLSVRYFNFIAPMPLNATNSLIGDPDHGSTLGTGANNILGTLPDLGSLQDNGGFTFTHEPNKDSPVIDKGNNADAPYNNAPSLTRTDQRGKSRIQDTTVDIGSVERKPIPAAACFSNSNPPA